MTQAIVTATTSLAAAPLTMLTDAAACPVAALGNRLAYLHQEPMEMTFVEIEKAVTMAEQDTRYTRATSLDGLLVQAIQLPTEVDCALGNMGRDAHDPEMKRILDLAHVIVRGLVAMGTSVDPTLLNAYGFTSAGDFSPPAANAGR